MAKKKLEPSDKAEATARVELVAKAAYERKHSTTEIIPPDVTRAKASAWLNLISPITEWAGLKGDALRYQRSQLRIQQDAALERLAHTIRMKMRNRKILQPLPPKVLVPSLEGASLEDPDSPLIEWWANLLVSGATRAPIRPFLVDLMTKLGAEEADFLNNIWKLYSVARKLKKAEPPNIVASYTSGYIHGMLDSLKERGKEGLDEKTFFQDLVKFLPGSILDLEERGIGVRLVVPGDVNNSTRRTYQSKILEQGVALDVCRSLNILGYHSETVVLFEPYPVKIDVDVVHFSELGVEFMSACQPESPAASKVRPAKPASK